MRRIIGQCSTHDLIEVMDHLKQAVIVKGLPVGSQIFEHEPTKKQKIALTVISSFAKCQIPLDTIHKVKEVLVWQSDGAHDQFQFKLIDPMDKTTTEFLRKHLK